MNKAARQLHIAPAKILLAGCFAGLMGIAVTARARAGGNEEEARVLFNEGVTHYNAGEHKKAMGAFREANRLNPSWKVLYNIGQSAAAAKYYGIAYEAFEQYLVKGGDELGEERRNEVTAEMDRLFRIVGSLEVVAPSGADVFVNGLNRGRTPLSGKLKVTVGVEHRILITKDDKTLMDETHKVSRGETIYLDARDDLSHTERDSDEPPHETATSTEKSDGPEVLDVVGWAAVGVGAAALIGCAVTGGMALSLNSDLEDACDGIYCDLDRKDDTRRLNTLSATTTTLAAVGGTVAAVGIGIIIFSRLKKKKEKEKGLTLSAAPILHPNVNGLAIEGRF